MARLFRESFENDSLMKKTQRQREESFVPVEQIPDPKPDPAETLMMKEESPKEEGYPKQSTSPTEQYDLSRPPSFNRRNVPDDTINPLEQIPPIGDEADEIAKTVESNFAKGGRVEPWDAPRYESHGKRGRKPFYKNRPTLPPESSA